MNTDGNPRVDRRSLVALSAALSLGIAPASSRGALARQANPEPTLLVRGEIVLPAEASMAWRVVRDLAEMPSEAAFAQRSTGFAVASSLFTSLLLTEEATGSAYRLVPHEAAFVRDGTAQRVESLDERPADYLRIKLVEDSAPEEASGYALVYSGPAFAIAAGVITLALQRAELMAGDIVGLSPGTGETLVLVEQGEVELEIGEAAPREQLQTTVGSGTSYAVRSVGPAAMLYATRDATNVLIATID